MARTVSYPAVTWQLVFFVGIRHLSAPPFSMLLCFFVYFINTSNRYVYLRFQQAEKNNKTKTLDPANRAAQRASGSFEDVEAGRLDDICAFIVRIAEIVSSAVIVVIANLSCVCELSAGVAEMLLGF
jgi:hypothetical protein